MSSYKTTYTIIGFDLSNYRDLIIPNEDILYNEDFEKWHYFKQKGDIQLFYDYTKNRNLYFGTIIEKFDQEENISIGISIYDIDEVFCGCENEIIQEFRIMIKDIPINKDFSPEHLLKELKLKLLIFSELS